MGAPTLDVKVQPTDNGKAYYLPIAAASQGEPEFIKLVLRLDIKNTLNRDVKLTGITFTYPDSNIAESTMLFETKAMVIVGAEDPPVRIDGGPVPTLAPGIIPKGETARWSNGVVDGHRNEVYLEAPAPPKVRVNLTFDGFSDPQTVTMDLIPYVNATGSGSLLMPFSPADLEDGEYIVTDAEHWANGGASGEQIFAHDIDIQKKVNGAWTNYNRADANSDNDANEDYLIWGKPVRAVADGTVKSFENDIDDNDHPGVKSKKGNIIKIIHGDITVSYHHLQKHSIPADLMTVDAAGKPNATVRAGDMVGLAGNSGRSSNPHLHIQAEDTATGTLRGLPFRRASVIDRDKITANGGGPWVVMTADGICRQRVAIWPGFKFRSPFEMSEIELAELAAEVFGGVSKGGDGFIFVNGKLKRVPPRGIRFKLLTALARLQSAEGNKRLTAEIGKEIARLARELSDGKTN